jgi:hypothetical protein
MKTSSIEQIFEDLDEYREFCIGFGRPYREQDLYNTRSPHYNDYVAMKEGNRIRNHWFSRPPFDPTRRKSNNFRYNNNNGGGNNNNNGGYKKRYDNA